MSMTEEEVVGRMVIDRGNIIMYIILTSRPRLLVVMGNVSQFRHFVKSYEISWYKQILNTFFLPCAFAESHQNTAALRNTHHASVASSLVVQSINHLLTPSVIVAVAVPAAVAVTVVDVHHDHTWQ